MKIRGTINIDKLDNGFMVLYSEVNPNYVKRAYDRETGDYTEAYNEAIHKETFSRRYAYKTEKEAAAFAEEMMAKFN